MKKLVLLFGAAVWCSASFAQSPSGRPAAAKVRRAVTTAFPAWTVEQDPATGAITDMYGKSVSLPGNTPVEKALACLEGTLAQSLGIRPSEWAMVRSETADGVSFVDYQQKIQGRDVVFSHLRFRFGTNNELVRLQVASYETPAEGIVPTKQPASLSGVAVSDLEDGATAQPATVQSDWAWFPVTTATGAQVLHPAYPFEAQGSKADGVPAIFRGWVDATTGQLLQRHDIVKEGLNLTVKGRVKKQVAPSGVQYDTVGLPNLQIQVAGFSGLFTDSLGFIAAPSGNLPATVTVPLQGRWSKVNIGSSNGATPSMTLSVSTSGATYQYPDDSLSVNAYYHVNRVHDFMKRAYPNFTALDFALPTNVDLTSGTCNAFYNGSSINFYAAGGGCPSFAAAGSVIYHEYGHGINDKFYASRGATTMFNGALNEGYADVWAMCITGSPVIGAQDPTYGIRNYGGTAKAIPVDIAGEVHADGEPIAGAWWDVAVNIGSVDTMARLFTRGLYDVVDGLRGNEGAIFKKALVSALLNDDNDNNLNNGTPHYDAIVRAFARHGIYYGAGTSLAHTELSHKQANQSITVQATITIPNQSLFGGAYLYYKIRGGSVTDSAQMTSNGAGDYTAQIPAQPAGTIVDYYFGIKDALVAADQVYFPAGYRPNLASTQATIPYQFAVGVTAGYNNDFEGALPGWTLGDAPGDAATAGKWVQASPVAAYQTGGNFASLISQVGADHTSGSGMCLVTANGARVTGGLTTAISPSISLAGMKDPIIEYYRWYGNDRGNNARGDYWRAQVRDTASALWYNIDYTKQADYQWRRRLIRVSDAFFGTIPLSIQVRFMAADQGNQGTVEAAVDDFTIYDKAAINTAGVAGVAPQRAGIFPNPANNSLTISLGASEESGSIMMYDASGRVVRQLAIENGQLNYNIQTSAMAAGTYFLAIKTAHAIQAHSIVVAH